MTWSTPLFTAIAGIIRERTGLVFPPSRRAEIENALERALPRNHHPDHIRALLETDDEATEALIAELTIGESYFLRDTGQFRLLRELLPRLAANRTDVPVRVWSAGCASGEEPYSVAILCEELGLGDRVTILGTDLSRARLAQAKRAVYRPWALRGVDEEVIDRFFEQRGPGFHLRPHLRERVEFRYLNLAEDRFPSLTAGIWGMDVILCRNVLIYFDRPTITRVAGRLVDTLSEDGWLVLGASDPAIGELVETEVVLTAAGLAYRRRSTERPTDAPPLHLPEPWEMQEGAIPGSDVFASVQPQTTEAIDALGSPREERADWFRADAAAFEAAEPTADTTASEADAALLDALERAYLTRTYERAEELARAAIARGIGGPRPWILLIRALANRGYLKDAGQAAAGGLERHRHAAELLYLHALLLSQSALHAEAAAAVRQALYLDRDLIVAHMALAHARSRMGDAEGARRALRNADALLGRLAPDAVVPASDGQVAGRLKQIVRAQLSVLAAAA